MRIWILVTVAALGVARDSARAQTVSVMAQAIPVFTRADPTATRTALDEGYISQPVVMALGAWNWLRGVATLNLEGLTLARGELSTGAYGEGYVDRRHPHTYAHELMAGTVAEYVGVQASLFAGRGFVPFGSDDPMVRPFEKYPVNHHLSQILERPVAVAAVRSGPAILEVGTFNGDEPISPSSAPQFDRFGDSFAARATFLPIGGLELSASGAFVKSPEVAAGGGVDQHKASIVGRFSRYTPTDWRYALAEWARTNETASGRVTNRLSSWLGEAAVCHNGFVGAARLERTDRPEEEQLTDPFRTPRPPVDLSTLGVSRWTTFTVSLSPPAFARWFLSGRPFVEVARIGAKPGNPPGLFNAIQRYGTDRMWMLSAGIRLRAGASHGRMGRYGVAAVNEGMTMVMGTDSLSGGSHQMMAMHHTMTSPCTL
jgi:hypothetical protein